MKASNGIVMVMVMAMVVVMVMVIVMVMVMVMVMLMTVFILLSNVMKTLKPRRVIYMSFTPRECTTENRKKQKNEKSDQTIN